MKKVEPKTPELSFRLSSVYAWKYSYPCTTRKVAPSSTVGIIHEIALRRWLAINAWCAIVIVTPELRSSAVFTVGSGQGPIAPKGGTMPAGDVVAPATTVGHAERKSGHSSWFSRSPSAGTECTRTQYSAPKKAPKNMTSEKMNQLMLQRNDTSTRREYRPRLFSSIAVWNQRYIVDSQITSPSSSDHAPHMLPLIHSAAPRITKNMPNATSAG